MQKPAPKTRDPDPALRQAQYALVQRRWPVLARHCLRAGQTCTVVPRFDTPAFTVMVDGIHLSSAVDRDAEAHLQAAQIPEHAQEVWAYGIGTGDLIRVLLQRPALQRLHVVPLNAAVFQLTLAWFEHRDWLDDPRVELHRADEQSQVRKPFAAVPACLRLADDDAARLRDQVCIELSTPFLRANFRERAQVFGRQLLDNQDLLMQDGDVRQLFGTAAGGTVLIAAAGPTLSDHFERLAARGRAEILIAVDAALRPLLDHGIVPDIVMTVDGVREGILPFFAGDLSGVGAIPLVYFPISHRDVLTTWPGPRLTAYTDHELYHTAAARHPKGHLFSSGTVAHAAVDLGVQMGAKRIELLGADFCFARGWSHVPGSAQAEPAKPGTHTLWVLNGRGERVPTLANLRSYLRDLEHYIARHPHIDFVNGSRDGARINGARYVEGSA